MTRVQVLLTQEQDRELEKLARQLRRSKASLVREGVDNLLQRRRSQGKDPLLGLIGQAGQVGRKDIARRHDELLAAAELRRNR